MIRHQYSSSRTLCDEEADKFDSDRNKGKLFRGGLGRGKRKADLTNGVADFDEGELLALSRLENLDLDSDEEDVLLLDDVDASLMDLEPEPVPKKGSPSPTPPVSTSTTTVVKTKEENGTLVRHVKMIRDVEDDDISDVRSDGENDDRANCPMRWLRTVGTDHTGKLICVVKGAGAVVEADNLSDSGLSGKTESLMADTIKGMINVYQKKRAEVLTKDGFIATPLHVVKELAAEHGEALHCESITFPNRLHRVELFSGTIRGIGEGMTKKIAAQMAAIDIMERIQLSGATVKVPKAAFLPGWLTSNRVFVDLGAYCRSYLLPPAKIICKSSIAEDETRQKVNRNRPKFRAECWVGEDLVTIGESETDIFARREAAKEMIMLITNMEYRDTPYAIGQGCRSHNELAEGGYQLIMSDYKKMWLLQNRVRGRQLMIPEEEEGIDEPFDLEELQREIDSMDHLALQLMSEKRTIKVHVNKRMRMIEDGGGNNTEKNDDCKTIVRRISVEEKIPNVMEDEEEDVFAD